MNRRIGLVAPGLALGGGVPAVARFIRDIAARSDAYEMKVISLATAAADPCNANLSVPSSWLRGAVTVNDTWEATEFTHVGAVAGELEFQRYRPRAVLRHALYGCDLIQVVCGSPAWANAVVGLGKPVALQVATLARVERRQRDASPRGFTGWWRKGMTTITNLMDDRGLRRVDAIQVENPWMLEYARSINTGHDVDIRYAPPGIDAQRFNPLPFAERVPNPYILCVGRLDDPRKNVGLLLEAYLRLPDEVRERTRLVLAGSSAPPAAIGDRAIAAGVRDRVSYVPKPDADALLDLYRHASVFALPSDEEGFGMVVIEAMACGVPVVATRCGGPDGIITDGKDGYLVPCDDAEAMSARLLCLLQEPDRNAAMGEAARQTIEHRYDEHVAGEVFLDMWDRLLHKSRASQCAG